MKTKKFLLPGMLATMMFAACTNEDIVSQQTPGVPEADLSKRPVVGMVDLNFGPQTRATLLDGSFGLIEWTEDDKIGARIIDNLKTSGLCEYHAVENYEVADYAWSNYRYDYNAADGKWTSGALMVEGNYMFYAPYNEEALYRTPLEVVFPIEQSAGKLTAVAADAKYASNTDAVQRFYASNDYTIAVGHTFVGADDENAGVYVSPRMTQLYAYPQLTLVNKYEVPVMVEDEETGELVEATDEAGNVITEGQSLKIDQITVYSDEIYKNGKINHKKLVDALKLDIVEAKETTDDNRNGKLDVLCAGKTFQNWTEEDRANDQRTEWFLKNARTSGIIDWVATTIKVNNRDVNLDGKVVITLDEPVTIPAGYKVSLNVVLPAEDYDAEGLGINVRVLAENNKGEEVAFMFKNVSNFNYKGDGQDVDGLHYAVAKRYAEQEYNYPANALPTVKTTAGALATFDLSGTLVEYDPEVEVFETEGIHNYDEFVEWLDGIKDNSTSKEEGEDFELASDHKLPFDAALMEAVNTYLNNANAQLTFTSDMDVIGGTAEEKLVIKGSKYPSFGKLTVKSGVVELNNVAVTELVIEAGATVEMTGSTSIGKISEVKGNVTLNGATLTAADNKGITFKGTADLTNVTVNGKAIFEKAATINGGSFADVEFKAGASLSGEITTTDGSKATVSGGDVDADNSTGWATVELYGGNLKITNKDYAPTVIVGKYDNKNQKEYKGTLTAAAEGLVLPQVSLNTKNSQFIVDKKVEIVADKFTWTEGSVTNNATLKYDVVVASDNTYTHNAVAVVDGTLENNGKVYNNGKLALTNNGEVIVGEGGFTKTDIVAGTGSINNNALGYVTGSYEDQRIFIETGEFDNDNEWSTLETTNSKVNTIRVTGLWTVGKSISAGAFHYELAGTGINLGAATIDFQDALSVEILNDQNWTGLDADVSIVENAEITFGSRKVDNVDVFYTLNVRDIDMDDAYVVALTEAITAGGNVVLGADVEVTSSLVIASDKTLNLNLNGHTLVANSGHAIENQGTLTLTGGTIETTAAAARGLMNFGTATVNCNIVAEASNCIEHSGNGTLTINGGKYETKLNEGSAVRMDTRNNNNNEIDAAWKLVINGGTFVSPWAAIYMANNYWDLDPEGSAVIKNATITGGTKADIVVNTCENIDIYKSCTLTNGKILVEGDMQYGSEINDEEIKTAGLATVALKN